MKPQSSMLTMLTPMFGVSRLSTKYFHGLQEAAKHEPWQARVLGTGNHHVEPISTMLRPVAGAKKNWMRVWIQDLQQKKKWKWDSRQQQVLETWSCCLPQAGFDSVLPWLANHARCLLLPVQPRSACRTLLAVQLGRNPRSPVLQKERL